MKNTLYILKRSNGCYGIYKNGKQPEHLISNSFLTDSANTFINRVLLEFKGTEGTPEIIFTDDESEFKNDLPKLEDLVSLNTERS